jgi:hypothetical protein
MNTLYVYFIIFRTFIKHLLAAFEKFDKIFYVKFYLLNSTLNIVIIRLYKFNCIKINKILLELKY